MAVDNRSARVLASIFLEEHVQEALDGQNASDDFMRVWTEREERAFASNDHKAPLPPPSQSHLSIELRQAAIRNMERNIVISSLPQKSWFDAVLLFDLYCWRAPSPVLAADLPVLCGAIIRLLSKMDDGVSVPNSIRLVSCAVQFANRLRQEGHTMNLFLVTEQEMVKQELVVTEVLRWQLNTPTVETWMSAFCARMDTLTQKRMHPAILSTWKQSICSARNLFMQRPASQTFSPQRVASGLLALGLIAADLVPATCLDLHERNNFGTIPQSVGSPKASDQTRQQFFLELLQVSTMSDIEALQHDVSLVNHELQITTGGKPPAASSS